MNTNALIITNSNPVAAAGTAATDIRGIKPPIVIPNYWIWLWVALVAVVIAAGIITALVLWRRKASRPPPIPYVPPQVRARRKLQEAMGLIDQPKPFCVLVSDTVRLYLEERFNFCAPERTTEEFLHELQATDLLLPDQKQSLGEFLSVCDMVKFARYEPGRPELQAMHGSATRLVDETEPQPEPAPTSDAGAATTSVAA
jgi:hypothetical protein